MSITERIRYGAAELKAAYNRNLALALAISILVHGAAIGLYLTTSSPAEAVTESSRPDGWRPDTTMIFIDNVDRTVLKPIETPPQNGADADPVRTNVGTDRPASSVADANPIVTDEPRVADETNYPTIDEIVDAGRNGEKNGDPNGGGEKGGGGEINGRSRTSPGGVPSPDTTLDATTVFYSDVVLPNVDMGDLMERIEYPRIARENGIEGTVNVRALIGRDGIVERVEVSTSSNAILNAAALEAVRATRFTAGSQNEVPVRVWIELPIRFRLE